MSALDVKKTSAGCWQSSGGRVFDESTVHNCRVFLWHGSSKIRTLVQSRAKTYTFSYMCID